MEPPDDVRTSQKSPIDTTGPRDATSRPTMSVTWPTQGSSSISAVSRISSCNILSIQLVEQAAFNFRQLRFHRSVKITLRGLKENFTGLEGRIRHQHKILRCAALFQRLSYQAFDCGVHAHAVYFSGLDLHESRLDQARKRVGIDCYLSVDNACRDRNRQTN